MFNVSNLQVKYLKVRVAGAVCDDVFLIGNSES